ncbi:uncharacterized protein J7T54_004307 [Emericellopsis cladophorae]|uniref:Uncharacterized protein n=1 Tax=Emericellopsis cladophorae TaxID=2686198 RepID=A0A9P9Y4N9_9HYPO|nr:uncharacterized protein J7T54_004307 [Emericellopsis cladophorae]KAI6783280.1 hypothetical protein J7T54_004307 [Emericellopsis cladophorae]
MMHRQTLRSVTRRTAPADVESLSAYFHQSFSTSTYFQADEPAPSDKPFNVRSKSLAAADKIKNLVGGQTRPAPAPRSNPGATGPKIVDIKSLPRGGLRGRGGFRGRGGASAGASAGGAGGGPNRFAGASRGNAARGGRGGASARGRRGNAVRKGRKKGEEGEEGDRKDRRFDQGHAVEPEAQAFMDTMRYGVTTTFNPSVTTKSLEGHFPAVPSGQHGALASVHQSLAALGGGNRVGLPDEHTPKDNARDLHTTKFRYFSDVESKDRVEAHLQARYKTDKQQVLPADEHVRKVVWEQAVLGKHEAPQFADAKNSTQIARNWQLRNETWQPREASIFEAKVASLLERAKPKGGAKQQQPKKA